MWLRLHHAYATQKDTGREQTRKLASPRGVLTTRPESAGAHVSQLIEDEPGLPPPSQSEDRREKNASDAYLQAGYVAEVFRLVLNLAPPHALVLR